MVVWAKTSLNKRRINRSYNSDSRPWSPGLGVKLQTAAGSAGAGK